MLGWKLSKFWLIRDQLWQPGFFPEHPIQEFYLLYGEVQVNPVAKVLTNINRMIFLKWPEQDIKETQGRMKINISGNLIGLTGNLENYVN